MLKCGIIENILNFAKLQHNIILQKQSGGKRKQRLSGIPKLDDANDAGCDVRFCFSPFGLGGKNSDKCTLILTEGDSAKALAVSGLGVVGRDHYGVMPLRGKILNVREATHKQITENVEINHIR